MHTTDSHTAQHFVTDVLLTVDPAILRSIVTGTLSLSKIRCNPVREALCRLTSCKTTRPASYHERLGDLQGSASKSPTAAKSCDSTTPFQLSQEEARLVCDIDIASSLMSRLDWSAQDIQTKRYCVFLDIKTVTEATGSYISASNRVETLIEFCQKLELRLKTSWPDD